MSRLRFSPVMLATLLIALLAGFAFGADPTAPRMFSPVQYGFTTDAEETLPYAPNRLLVQISEGSMAKSLLGISLDKGSRAPGAQSGLVAIDELALDAGIISIERPYLPLKNAAKAASTGFDRWFMFNFDDVENLPALADEFAALGDVQAVSLDWRAYPAVTPSDPYYVANWGHNNTVQLPGLDWGGTYDHTLATTVGTAGFDANAPQAWDAAQAYGSAAVVIAIIDSGVDVLHTDIRRVTGYDFGDNDTNPDDNSTGGGHGTCCAGVAAAMNNGSGAVGVAAGCSIMPLKVANSAGSMFFSAIQSALYYAADNGAEIVSMSLGAAITSDAATDAAIQYAYNAGVTILAATGNENKTTISYPAVNTYVIGVGAASPCGDRKRSSSLLSEVNTGVSTDPRGYTCDGERWWGSNYGTTTANAAGAVDIIGPTILPTCDITGAGGYRTGDIEPFFNGTSCATPYVAGVAALIKSANPAYTPAQVRAALINSARDVVNVESVAGWDRYSGYGMVDAQAAVGGTGPVAPVATFTGTPTSGTSPLTVVFTDASTGSPTSWSWTFGDGGTSTVQNPSHVYTTGGTYTVALTVANATGSNTQTRTGYITVGTVVAPVAAFTGTPVTGTAPLAVTFTDQSTNAPTSWSWTFGDGGTSTVRSPSHTYAASGTYTVALTATNAAGSNTLTRTGYITVTASTGTWQTITYDTFEAGMGTYTDGGADMARYTSTTYSYAGTSSADIQDNSGTPSSFYHTLGYNVSAYVDLKVDFYFRSVSMENGEDFWLEYYNGTAWVRAATLVAGTNFTNTGFYHSTISIPKATFAYPTNAKLRFRCDASDNSDDIYIDEIRFSGLTASGADAGYQAGLPAAPVTLAQNEPNPFNPATQIKFNLRSEGAVKLTIYNLRGQMVATLADGTLAAGEHVVTWDASEHASGVYFYRLEGPGFSETRKMTMLK
jgi:PKD repeat protein